MVVIIWQMIKFVMRKKNAILVTFTFNGESHEFVQYVSSGPANKAGIAHWPGCIYCNRQNQEGNPDSIQQAK